MRAMIARAMYVGAVLWAGPSWAGEPAPAAHQQPSVEELIARRLPTDDDWTSEHLHTWAKKQLKSLASQLADPHRRDRLDLSNLVSPRCRVNRLRPVENAPRLESRGFTVRRAPRSADDPLVSDVAAQFRAITKPYGSIGGQRFDFKAYSVVDHGNGRSFNTLMYFQCYGATPNGVLQQNAFWDITWEIGDDREHPLIERIIVSDWIEVSAKRPTLVDRTNAVLSSVKAWHQQLPYGVDFWHHRVDTLGGVTFLGHQGIAIGDVNNDGLDDLYVAQSTGMPNLLLIQNPDGTVTESAAPAGVDFLDDTKGVLLVDIDNDGDQDLICAIGATLLVLTNDGRARFAPVAALRAPGDSAFYMIAAADFDEDGDLDLYATRYVVGRYGVSIPVPWHDANNGPSNHLFRNDGHGEFVDVTRETGLDVHNRRFSLAAGWEDYDDDGDPDLYVVNDFGRNNLYRNDRGTFTDVAGVTGTEDQAAGMGVSWADFDLDGRLDLHVGNMFSSAGRRIAYQRRFKAGESPDTQREFQRHALGNSLYRNAGDGTFHDVSASAGIRMGRWSWGARFVDLNNDGYPDIVSPNGFITNESKDDL